jgi:hypothetical protein
MTFFTQLNGFYGDEILTIIMVNSVFRIYGVLYLLKVFLSYSHCSGYEGDHGYQNYQVY